MQGYTYKLLHLKKTGFFCMHRGKIVYFHVILEAGMYRLTPIPVTRDAWL